jgi:predicted nucleic acid-binding protein
VIYTLDTNLWIDAFRQPAELDRLKGFLSWALPQTTLTSVVAAELLAGARTETARRGLESEVLEPFARRGRLRAPRVEAWHRAGVLLGELRLPRAHAGWQNDLLLASMAREHGWVLLTRDSDFHGLRQHIRGLQVQLPYPRRANS